MKTVIIVMIIVAVILVGCSTIDAPDNGQNQNNDPTVTEDEDTGIGDVFDDPGDVTPPEIPV